MTIKALLNGIDQLVSLPEAVIRAYELLESPHASAAEIGEVIGHDPALSARLLKLVNSAFYGVPGQVDSISRAITLIGTRELQSLIIAASATSAFARIDPALLDMNAFWHRSVYCALVAKKLAELNRRDRKEAMFLAGLLHNVGLLVLFLRWPERTNAVLQQSARNGSPVYRTEQAQLGFTSAELGAALLATWRLPERLCKPVRFQHQPEAADAYVDEAFTLNLALTITDRVEPELKTGAQNPHLEALDNPALAAFGLDLETANLIALDACVESLEVLGIINPGAAVIY